MATVGETIVQAIADLGVRIGLGRRRRRAEPDHRRDPPRGAAGVDRRAPRGGRRVRGRRPGAARRGTLGVCMGTVGPGLAAPAQRPLRRQEVPCAGAGDLRAGAAGRVGLGLLSGGRQRRGVRRRGGLLPHRHQSRRSCRACSSRRSSAPSIAPGVAVLTVPGDVAALDVDGPRGAHRPRRHAGRARAAAQLRARPSAIDAAERVTLLVGRGARHARTEVLELADRLAAPMVLTLKAKAGPRGRQPVRGGPERADRQPGGPARV